MTDALLPPPDAIGAPDHFTDWRPDQPAAILRAIDSPHRFVGLVMPTGSGKSLTYVSAALLTGKRTAILTSTKGLQTQLLADFESCGLVDVRGQNAYDCIALRGELSEYAIRDGRESCEDGPCHAGIPCSLSRAGCLYYDAIRRAQRAPLVVTNYKFWLAQKVYGMGLGTFDQLVLDEAHNAPDELASFLSTTLSIKEIEVGARSRIPAEPDSLTCWKRWAEERGAYLAELLDQWKPSGRQELALHRQTRHVLRKLQTLRRLDPDTWILIPHGSEFTFDPIWASEFAEEALFQQIPRVLFTSATFNAKTAALLGIEGRDALDLYEVASGFPVARRPVIYTPLAPPLRVDYKMTQADERRMIAHVDNIIRQRRDRKGIVHTISYKRRNLLIQHSEFADSMIAHDTATTRTAVEKFKASGPGTILVSPSITTGWDFPYSDCEYQIVLKVPFPDSREPVMQARTLQDKDYPAYLAMQQLVQAVGRGMRAADDQCETFVVDDHAQWFLRKYRHLAPRWFFAAYRTSETIPSPPPPLARGSL